jgi:hypothetical protein
MVSIGRVRLRHTSTSSSAGSSNTMFAPYPALREFVLAVHFGAGVCSDEPTGESTAALDAAADAAAIAGSPVDVAAGAPVGSCFSAATGCTADPSSMSDPTPVIANTINSTSR